MAKVYDVPADLLIGKLADILKSEDIPAPSWIPFVKTGAHADKPPQDREWWHTRCASIMRKIYLHGPIGINELRKDYGGGKPSGYGAAHHKDAGGCNYPKCYSRTRKTWLCRKSWRRKAVLCPNMECKSLIDWQQKF